MTKLTKHKHRFEQVGEVFHASEVNPQSTPVITAKILYCSACGHEERVLTPAGQQQLAWGDSASAVYGKERKR